MSAISPIAPLTRRVRSARCREQGCDVSACNHAERQLPIGGGVIDGELGGARELDALPLDHAAVAPQPPEVAFEEDAKQ